MGEDHENKTRATATVAKAKRTPTTAQGKDLLCLALSAKRELEERRLPLA
jgi:hypothetical protein